MFHKYITILLFLIFAGTIALISLLYAFILYKKIKRLTVDHERIKDIGTYIYAGSMAYMKRQYRIIIYVSLIIAVLLTTIGFIPLFQGAEGIGYKSAITFLVGALFSGFAGFIGMHSATRANTRTTDQARKYGMSSAIRQAFTGGSVLGLSVVGLGLFGLIFLFLFFYTLYGGYKTDIHIQYQALRHAIHVVTGYGLGASLIALFGRVGGGIYTKAADVASDLVGKIESDIPEDDPRNPAVIADNVGDNVGDIAGMGSDLTESYVGSLISALTLGLYAFIGLAPESILLNPNLLNIESLSQIISFVIFPLVIASIGIFSTILAILFVRMKNWKNPQKTLDIASYLSSFFMIIMSLVLCFIFFEFSLAIKIFGALSVGLFVGIAIGFIAQLYTSDHYKHVKEIVEQSKTGHATNVIAGFSVGMKSTSLTIFALVLGIILSYLFTKDMYGIAIASVGMLSTAGMIISVDAYGPIVDNAGGIAEMSNLDKSVRMITDELDSVGNTTAAIGKGFCIGSAALTSLALFFAFEKAAGLSASSGIDILQVGVMVGILIGAMLPYLFTSLVIKSVGKAAFKMIEEVRRQYKEDPNILLGTSMPDYGACVDISTKAALHEMILPAMLAILSPIIIGILLGPKGLGGMLVGGLVSAIMLAIFMANAGGAWDNAKKYIEKGHLGGKGTEIHKASITGDTVGDPLKDTAGPSMDILIKLMSIVSLMIIPILLEIEPLLKSLFS